MDCLLLQEECLSEDKMNIVFCADRRYIEPIAVTLTSVILSNNNEKIDFHIISADFSDNERRILENIIEKFGCSSKQKIHIYLINDQTFKKMPTMGHISIATYFRLMMTEILPQSINKVLYLDGDILVVDSLKAFYNKKIDTYAVSAVRDAFNDDIAVYNRLEYSKNNGYFNAGVLLINLDYWRKNDVAKKSFDFIRLYPEKCVFSDQDVLNKILNGNVLWADFRYDCIMSYLYPKDFSELKISIEYKDEIIKASNNPCIIHFTGGCKPWFEDYNLCYRKLYVRIYEAIFNHKNKIRYSRHGVELLKWRLKKILTKLKIKNYGNFEQDCTYDKIENTIMNRMFKS